jgi:hypothetical protein
LIGKPFEPNEMKEALADMLDLPQGCPPSWKALDQQRRRGLTEEQGDTSTGT